MTVYPVWVSGYESSYVHTAFFKKEDAIKLRDELRLVMPEYTKLFNNVINYGFSSYVPMPYSEYRTYKKLRNLLKADGQVTWIDYGELEVI